MAVSAIVDGFAGLEVINYSVSQDATPLTIGDSSGSVGSIKLSVVSRKTGPIKSRTCTLIDRDLVLVDLESIEDTPYRGRGSVFGNITSLSEPGGQTSITADTIIARLNTDRTAPPFYGRFTSQVRSTYLVNVATNPSLETNTTNWSVIAGTGGTAALTRANTAGWAAFGSYFARAAWTAGTTADGGGIAYTHSTIAAGDAFTVSAYVRTSRGAQVIRPQIDWLTSAGGSVISTVYGAPISLAGGTATSYRASAFGTAPPFATAMRVSFQNYDDGTSSFGRWVNGDVFTVDGLLITSGDTLMDYFDGTSAGAQWLGTPHGSASMLTVQELIETGYDATVAEAFRMYCGLVGIPRTSIQTDSIFSQRYVSYPSWTGNVWNHIKMMCAAEGAEVVVVGTNIELREPRTRELTVENKAGLVVSVDTSATAQNVQIVNYNNRWLTDYPAHQATSIASVDVGNSSITRVTTLADLESVNNPSPLGSIPSPYLGGPGAYTILDSDGVVVSPSWWTNNGGSVTVALVPDSRDIDIAIVGPRIPGPYTAPFRIADAVQQPSMVITGTGLFTDPETVTMATGASEAQTSNIYAAAIDNIFISSMGQAVDRGFPAAQVAGGPVVKITGTINVVGGSGQDFGIVEGSRIRHEANIYRVTSANYTRSSVTFSGIMDVTFNDAVEAYGMTFDEHNAIYAGYTFDTFNALWSPTATFDDVNAAIPQATFDDINVIYEGLTFNDQAVFPLLTARITEDSDAEARI